MRTADSRRWLRPLLGTMAAVTLLAAAACSGGAEQASNAGSAAPAKGAPAPGPADRNAQSDQGSTSGYTSNVTGTLPQQRPLDLRSIVYTGELTVRTPNVDEVAASASAIATGAGGFVAGDNRKESGNSSTADLVLRVPAAAFYGTVDKVVHLGKPVNRGIHTDDVTDTAVDLDTRIASQKASVDRTRALLARAERIADIVTIEGELSRREADLGALEARKRTLTDQVSLSTINVHLIHARAAAPKKARPANFLTGLAAGWDAFTTSLNALLVAAGAVLPFLLVIGIPLAAALVYLRRRRPRPVTAPAPATGPDS